MAVTNPRGFTLIELLIGLVVASILLGIGIPSFSGAISGSRVSADYNELTGALYYARSEAVKTNEHVTVCPKSAVNSEHCGSLSDDWKNGWIVFIDINADELSASIDNEDEIIAIHPAQRSDNTLLAQASSDLSDPNKTSKNFIRYDWTGKADWGNGSFYLCNDDEVARSRVLNVAPTGDIRPGRKSDSDYPRDVWGQEACVI